MKVGLFGGSFDPLHHGHLKLARAALDQLGLAKVYFILSPQSPLKKRSSTPVRLRWLMLRSGLKSRRNFQPVDWELKRKGPSYTIRTVRDYKRRHPRHELYLIMGSDSLCRFDRWKSHQEILRLAFLAVGLRPGSEKNRMAPAVLNRARILKGRFPDISSTHVRKNIFERASVGRMLPPAVKSVILNHGLYGAPAKKLRGAKHHA